MQFLYPALTVGFLLALLPLLIHLINMMRHQRVQWAAMEFLLQSYKKHRRWVWLKQLLLLLARMAAIALLVAMLAQLVTQRRYEGLFGNTLTHHYVLLDDSMSMSDRSGGTDAFERGLKFIQQLGMEAATQELQQRFTLVRFSQAALADKSDTDAEQGTPVRPIDLNAVEVDSRFSLQLGQLRNSLYPSEMATSPEAALQLASRLMQQQQAENAVVYLVSDFRRKEWDNPSELRKLLSDVDEHAEQIRLINCSRQQRSNLAITDLAPTQETRASGVPLFMNVAITNYGAAAAEKVQLRIRTYFYSSNSDQKTTGDQPEAKIEQSPMIEIDKIGPGETATQRVQVYFPDAGKHVVEAMLPEDAIAADNRRWCVVEFPDHESVLVIDGDPSQRNAFYVGAIFEPGQRARTGIRPEMESTAYLRDTTPELLQRYSSIYLLDVDRLDDRAVTNLQTFVEQGGGLAVFVGPQVNIEFYNRALYQNGDGLFPLPLERDALLDSDPADNTPDLYVETPDHAIFRELAQGQNPIVRMIHIQRYLQPPRDWTPAPEGGLRVLARLRNRAPLAVEKSFGEGRVVAFLTTYGPYWNDIALGPGVVLTLRLQSHLGNSQRELAQPLVATGISVRLEQEKFRRDFRVFAPGNDPETPLLIERPALKMADDARHLEASVLPAETTRSGIYEMCFNRVDGSAEMDRFAINVATQEGNLAQTPTQDIVTSLDPVQVEMGYADQFESSAIEDAGFNQSLLIMCLLLLLLLGEQLLAYFSGYHPSPKQERPVGGRAGRGWQKRRDWDAEDLEAATDSYDSSGWSQSSKSTPSAAPNQTRATQSSEGASL